MADAKSQEPPSPRPNAVAPGVGFALAPRRRSDQLQPTARCLSGGATSRQPRAIAPCHAVRNLPVRFARHGDLVTENVVPLSVGKVKPRTRAVTFATEPL